MKRSLLFIAFLLVFYNIYGQLLTVKDFLSVSSLTPKKFYDYIYKRNFVLTGRDWQNDTIVNTFSLRMKRNVTDTQHVTRAIDTYQSGKNFSYAFQTSSGDDYAEARKELKEEGFFCSNEDDSVSFFLYQQKNVTVLVNMKIDAYDTLYT
ncbi:MAG: hypothetical protein JJE22_01370, partial [Bacteroidia bacterium]|nr:hypothetical protein [Bacteroidia bacterium]